MNRITISLVQELEEQLRKIQGGLIQGKKEDVSFTTTINLVLLSGILSTNNLSDDTLISIKKFMNGDIIQFDLENQIEEYINELIDGYKSYKV